MRSFDGRGIIDKLITHKAALTPSRGLPVQALPRPTPWEGFFDSWSNVARFNHSDAQGLLVGWVATPITQHSVAPEALLGCVLGELLRVLGSLF